jgi:hypothetical protein
MLARPASTSPSTSLILIARCRRLCSDLRKLEGGLPLLKGVVDLATAEVKDVNQFQEQVVQLVAELKNLEPGKVKMVPGGWDGSTGASTVVHLVEREVGGTFAFVTCNGGKGLVYHPCAPDAPKIKYKTCMRIERVPEERMTSPAFWAVLLSQWMKVRTGPSDEPDTFLPHIPFR